MQPPDVLQKEGITDKTLVDRAAFCIAAKSDEDAQAEINYLTRFVSGHGQF